MVDSASDDSHLISRIVKHMNKDHSHNIEDFLVIYGHVDQEMAKRNPAMESLSLGAMTLSYIDMEGTKNHVRIPIQPTMESFHDARSKLVEMAQISAHKRGFSEYVLNDVPFLANLIDYVAIFLFMALYFFAIKPFYLQLLLEELLPSGSTISEYIMKYHVTLFRILLGLHSVEALLILYPLLRKYRMNTLKKYLCLLLCLIEGIIFLSSLKKSIEKAQNPNRSKEK